MHSFGHIGFRRDSMWAYGLTAVATVCGVSNGLASGVIKVVLIVTAVATALASACVFAARTQLSERTAETTALELAKTRELELVEGVLSPLIQQAASMAVEPDDGLRLRISSALRQAVVVSATQCFSARQVRASIYELTRNAAGTEELAPTTYFAGRGDRPRRHFPEGHPAMAMVKDGSHLYEEDSGTQSTEYKTYIAQSITADNKNFGMLNVDSPFVGDLLESDQPLLRTLSAVVALTYAVT